MKKAVALLAALSFCMTAHAQADFCCENNPCIDENNFYAEVFGGGNFLQTTKRDGIRNDYRPGYIVSGSLGYRMWCGFRLEAEYAFRRNSTRRTHFFGRSFALSGHHQSSSYMANLLWELPISSLGIECRLRPFFGGGVGYTSERLHASQETMLFNERKKGFAWQILAGLAYPVFCNTDLSLEYKFYRGRFKDIYNHSVGVGLTYSFGL